MNDAQTCDLCAGKCRGHSLGHADQWEPEVGSFAHAQAIVERLTDAEQYATAAKAPTIRYDLAQDGSIAEKPDPKIVWLADAVLSLSEAIRALLEKQNG